MNDDQLKSYVNSLGIKALSSAWLERAMEQIHEFTEDYFLSAVLISGSPSEGEAQYKYLVLKLRRVFEQDELIDNPLDIWVYINSSMSTNNSGDLYIEVPSYEIGLKIVSHILDDLDLSVKIEAE